MASRWRVPTLSLTLRITAFLGLAMTAMFAIFTVQIGHSIERHFEEQDLGELGAVASSLETALGDMRATDPPETVDRRLAAAVAGHHGVFFAVRDERGAPHYGTAPDDLTAEAMRVVPSTTLSNEALVVWTVQDRTYRGAVLKMRGALVLVAVAIDLHVRFLAQLHQTLWWGTVAVCAVAVIAAWLAVVWGHAPMRRLSARIASITSSKLHVRLEPAGVPFELVHLVTSFNLMLDRLQESFERLSHFSGDIAHELRTPVTNLMTQTEVALSKTRGGNAYREVLYSNLEELARMGKMIGDMLFLA
ncbi:MAG: histidine kinase dimerization/phospho-acceptor domain-containing protein, partial [Nitrospira sp.]